MISLKDRNILRNLAAKQLEIAKSPVMEQIKKDWMLHNTFRGEKVMVHIELETFAQEIIPDLLECEGEEARAIETRFYKNIVNYEKFGDDYVVNDFYGVGNGAWFELFGIDVDVEHVEGSVGHQFIHQINDLEEDFHKFKPSPIYFDKDYLDDKINFLDDIFGDILPIKVQGGCLYAVPTQKVVHFMGMENMLISMYDYPKLFKKMMDMIADDYIKYFDFLEKKNLLLPTVGSENLGQGTWCFTDELPNTVNSSKDVWGFLDSQETVGISPDMFSEYIFPCYEKIAKRYGLLSYGCCEPVDGIFDKHLSNLDNLRKISISAWCNEEIMGEKLKGKNIVYHRKPSANFLGVGNKLDEEAFIKHIDKTIKASRGCTLEITQRDVYTVNKDVDKVRRYVEIIRQRCSLR